MASLLQPSRGVTMRKRLEARSSSSILVLRAAEFSYLVCKVLQIITRETLKGVRVLSNNLVKLNRAAGSDWQERIRDFLGDDAPAEA